MENLSSTQFLLFALVLTVISMIIFYVIIKAAVKEGTKETHQTLRTIAFLKMEEMRRAGYSNEELQTLIDNSKEV